MPTDAVPDQNRDFDLDWVRAQFPAFAEPSLNQWAFFENAGGSYAAGAAIDRLTRYYRETKVQPYAPYPASERAGAEMDLAHERFAAALNVAPDEVVFGPSTTQNVYVLAHAFAETWSTGDAVIVTDQDHEANIGAWRRLAARGVEVREWAADPETGLLALDALERLLDGRVRVVAATHCSNIVGAPQDARAIADRVHAAGAVLVMDGVSYAPHGLPDIDALGADIYLFSLYKTYGPHQGAMVVRRSVMERLANQSHDFNDGSARKRLTPAGPDHAQVAAANGVIDYLDALHDRHFPETADAAQRARRTHALMRARETALLAPLVSFLADRNDARLLGPRDATAKAPTLALDTRRDPTELAAALADRKMMVGASDFYAPRILRRLDVDPDRGALRLSFTHYTSPDEVSALMDALDAEL